MPNAGSLTAAVRENAYLERALQQLPAYGDAVELRAAILSKQRELRGAGTVPTPLKATQLADYMEAVRRNAADKRAFDDEREAIGALRIEIDNRVLGLVEKHSTTLITALAADLADVVSAVGGIVAKLHGATTAEEAIKREVETHWRDLQPLRRQYDEIRVAQKSIVPIALDATLALSARSQHIEDDLASDLMLHNLDEIVPGWRRAPTGFAMGGRPPADRRPWPTEPLAQLIWLSASPAQPWIPTAAELRDLHTERRERLNNGTDEDARPKAVNKHNQPVPTFTAINRELAGID